MRQEVRKVLAKMVQKGQAMVDLLDNHAPSGTPYAQVGTILIRKCIHPRMIHLMRAIYHEDLQEALADADQALVDMLRTLWRWETKFTTYQSIQVTMNLRDGGIGLRSLASLSPLAHLACWASTGSHVEQTMPASAGWFMRDLGHHGSDRKPRGMVRGMEPRPNLHRRDKGSMRRAFTRRTP